jgi:hypothetical protein
MKRRHDMKTRVIVTLAALAALASTGAVAQTEETVEDGVRYMRSQEEAPEVLDVTMEPVWTRGDENDEIFFGMPIKIIHGPAGNVYVLDSQVSEILVFSNDGEYLRTIGREGEGPGEFRNANDLYLGPGDILGVLSVFPGKVVQLTLEGDPAGNFPLPKSEGEGFQLLFKGAGTKDRIVLCGAKQRSGPSQTRSIQSTYLKAFDKDGNELARYHTEESETQYGGMQFDEKTFNNFAGYWSVSSEGVVAAAVDFDDYRVRVWNPDGSPKYVIERPGYAPLERSEKEKKRFQRLYDGITSYNPNSTFKVSDTHRAVMQVFHRPDGSLWVQSGRGAFPEDEGVFTAYDVYDGDGRFIRRVRLVGEGESMEDGVQFAGDRFYRITDLFGALMANYAAGDTESADEEESEPLRIIAYDIDLPALGSK